MVGEIVWYNFFSPPYFAQCVFFWFSPARRASSLLYVCVWKIGTRWVSAHQQNRPAAVLQQTKSSQNETECDKLPPAVTCMKHAANEFIARVKWILEGVKPHRTLTANVRLRERARKICIIYLLRPLCLAYLPHTLSALNPSVGGAVLHHVSAWQQDKERRVREYHVVVPLCHFQRWNCTTLSPY